MKKVLLVLTTFLLFFQLHAQSIAWEETTLSKSNIKGKQYIFPEVFRTYKIDYQNLKNILDTAPLFDLNGNIYTSKTSIQTPLPNGDFELFKLVESPVYEDELIEQYPGIKTFLAYAPNHPEWYARFDITPLGFHAIILGTKSGTIYIDPVTHLGQDLDYYLVYNKKDFRSDKIFECGVTNEINTLTNNNDITASRFGNCQLRTYRLALAATGEYTQFHGGTVANALAAQVTSINRVNAVYERDMSIHLNLIANNGNIIYTNSGTDPYTNNDGYTMLAENQSNIDAVIGSANYDIGHVFSTGGGGIASLESPCNNSTKARGVTGSPSPVNDPFDIDYVCHEMGHQFGGNHTFNGTNGSCGGGNRNLATAFEPGSGTTIQAYAGICTGQNVQSNSDDYFHGISMEEIGDFITSTSHTCPTTTTLSNNGPTVSYPSTSITIPANTPFALTAIASDIDGDILTYCWEQMNNENSTQPPVASATGGPNFRSFSPSTSPTRYFPNMADIIAGNSPTWEVLPSITRTLDFRVVVRDNATGGGCNDHTDISVQVSNSAGPFIVNSPNSTGISWSGNTNETVTWDVANTASAPVSCSDVNILISYDGGLTFPDTLAENVSNDGSHNVIVPNIATTEAYIMVQCANGTFFDVSDNSFTIIPVSNDFTLNTTSSNLTLCPNQNAIYNIEINKVGVFNTSVSLNTTGLPSGVSASFSNNNSTPLFNSILTITNTSTLSAGTYTFSLTATGSTGTKTENLSFTIEDSLNGNLSLTSPSNNATGVSNPTDFTWSAINGANYAITIASDINLSNIVEYTNNLNSNSYTSNSLNANSTYYWQIIAYNNCDTITSVVNTFTTENCIEYQSTDIPIVISSTGTPTITSDIVISGTTGAIADINVVNLTGTHSWISDLTFTLTSPSGTEITLLEEICYNQDDFNINFDDAATNNNYPCPPNDGGTYIPETALSAFNNETANGTWILTIEDAANYDGGNLSSWGLNICLNPPPCSNSFSTQYLAPACDSVFANNTWYYQNSSYNDTLVGQATSGCDSIITYYITVINSSPTTVINNTSCNPNDVGSVTNTYTNNVGCDSIVTINTSLISGGNSYTSITACDSVLINAVWYYNSINFSDTLSNSSSNGCDSIVNYQITIHHSTMSSTTISTCNSATVNGNVYTSSQTIVDTFNTVNGCDSIHTTYLTINYNSPPTNLQETTCNNNNIGTSTTTYTNVNGCDSVVTITTTLDSYSSSNIYLPAACDSIYVASHWFYNSTSFNDTLIGQANGGCDSIITYNLTVNNSVNTTETLSDCDSVLFNNVWYTSSHQFNFPFTSSYNCDSTHTVNIYVGNNIDTTVIQNNNTLTAQQNGAQYQWLDCDNNFAPILGADSQTYVATNNGNYAVQINYNGCTYTSTTCYNINSIGIKDNALSEYIHLYPNPTNGQFTIELSSLIENLNVKIYSVDGKIISQHQIKNQLLIPLSIDASTGVYFVELTSASSNAIIKVIKK